MSQSIATILMIDDLHSFIFKSNIRQIPLAFSIYNIFCPTIMELKTIIESHGPIEMPAFEHTFHLIDTTKQPTTQTVSQLPNQSVLAPMEEIPYSLIFTQSAIIDQTTEYDQIPVNCYILFGIPFSCEQWKKYTQLYGSMETIQQIYRFQGKNKTLISLDGSKQRNSHLQRFQNDRKLLLGDSNCDAFAEMYTVKLVGKNPSCEVSYEKYVYYLPFCEEEHGSCNFIKTSYFNNKMLHTLNSYVSLENKCVTCYKDLGHHEFENLLYGGRVNSCHVYVRVKKSQQTSVLTLDFLSKVSTISMTDKHLLEEVDPSNLSGLKKQIRKLCLEENRLRNCLTLEKKELIDEIEAILQLLNLKQCYPNKMTFHSIDNEVFKKIKLQNIDKKTNWIKQQLVILKNLDLRMDDLHKLKLEYHAKEMQEHRKQNQEIQRIRQEIIMLDKQIQLESSKNSFTCLREDNVRRSGDSLAPNKEVDAATLIKLERERLVRFEMTKMEFASQKEFIVKRTYYSKAAQELFTYLIDC